MNIQGCIASSGQARNINVEDFVEKLKKTMGSDTVIKSNGEDGLDKD